MTNRRRKWLTTLALAMGCGVVAWAQARVFHAEGRIASFGPDRAYVNIAHEDIPGFMAAMTMSFRPRQSAQVEGLRVGQRVAFRFTVDAEDQRWLEEITVK